MGPRALPLAADLLSVLLVREEFPAGSPLPFPSCAIEGNSSSLNLQSGVKLEKRIVLPANRSVEAEG